MPISQLFKKQLLESHETRNSPNRVIDSPVVSLCRIFIFVVALLRLQISDAIDRGLRELFRALLHLAPDLLQVLPHDA